MEFTTEIALNAINIILTFCLGAYVVFLNRKPEIEKVSYNEVMTLLKQKLDEAATNWIEIENYIKHRQSVEFEIYLSILNKKIKDDSREIDPKQKGFDAINNINDADRKIMNDFTHEDIEASRLISNLTRDAISNTDSFKYFIPDNFKNLLKTTGKNLLVSGHAGMFAKDKNRLDNSIRYLYKYLKVLEIAYYSGLNRKLIIDEDDLKLPYTLGE